MTMGTLVFLIAVLSITTKAIGFFSTFGGKKSKKQLAQYDLIKRQLELLNLEQNLKEKGIDLSSVNLGAKPDLYVNNSSISPISKILFGIGIVIVAFAVLLLVICYILG